MERLERAGQRFVTQEAALLPPGESPARRATSESYCSARPWYDRVQAVWRCRDGNLDRLSVRVDIAASKIRPPVEREWE
jgi:hypothetical protein